MKVGENPLYTMMARYLELATEVVLEPPHLHSADAWLHTEIRKQKCRHPDQIRQLMEQNRPKHVIYSY